MHELLHYASGARSSIVMANVNRTPASPWGFWPDQLDSLSQRDTGWVQLYSESPQESLDTVIQAFVVAESLKLPVMVSHDAFYVSHSMEPVEVPEQSLVDTFLPKFAPEKRLDTSIGQTFGAPIDQATWRRSRIEMASDLAKVPEAISRVGSAFGELTGRSYDFLEQYRCEGAETVIVTMGSMCGTAREAVDALREQGVAVGLLKVRLFRPLPEEALREALKDVPSILVLDRNYSPAVGGILHQELKSALSFVSNAPRIHGLLAGVGGVNVSADKIGQWVRDYRNATPESASQWVE